MFAGIAGLVSLVVQNMHHKGIKKLTIAFNCIVGIGAAIILFGICPRSCGSRDWPVGRGEDLSYGIGGTHIPSQSSLF